MALVLKKQFGVVPLLSSFLIDQIVDGLENIFKGTGKCPTGHVFAIDNYRRHTSEFVTLAHEEGLSEFRFYFTGVVYSGEFIAINAFGDEKVF